MKHLPGKPSAQERPFSSQDVHGALRVLQVVQRALEKNSLGGSDGPDHQRLVKVARIIHSLRRERTRLFPADLFGEPSWDILLSLYIAEREGFRMQVSAVCGESGVPETTALRWIERLKQVDLIKKVPAPVDGRVWYVELTSEGLWRTEEMLRSASKQIEAL